MKNNQSVVIVDADAIIAQANPTDSLHLRAVVIAKKLKEQGVELLYPSTTIAETVTSMQRVLNNSQIAYHTAKILTSNEIKAVVVTEETMSSALQYFNPNSSKKNTFFDCIVAAVAKEYNADAIFSFDSIYKKLGFKNADDLLKEA